MTKQQKAEYKAKRLAALREGYRVVAGGFCPRCGTRLYRNLSLTGWYVCGHRGASGFQREPGPHCDYDIFYDPTPEQHAQIASEY